MSQRLDQNRRVTKFMLKKRLNRGKEKIPSRGVMMVSQANLAIEIPRFLPRVVYASRDSWSIGLSCLGPDIAKVTSDVGGIPQIRNHCHGGAGLIDS